MIKSVFQACLLGLAVLAAANPLPVDDALERRDHTTNTVTVTTWAPAATATVNPLDITITKPAGWTSTVQPPYATSTITSGCVGYSYIYPPSGHSTGVVTTTVTRQSTVTVTDTNRPIQTSVSYSTAYVTVTTPLVTLLSYYCTNTLVLSYYTDADSTYTWSQFNGGYTFVTEVCLTSVTRSTTIPGVTVPTTVPLNDWDYFGSTTLYTKATRYQTDATSEFPGVGTATVCNNPSPRVNFTVHVTRYTTTQTVFTQRTDQGCSTSTRAVTPRAELLAARQDAPSATPIEVLTVIYTTVLVLDNTAQTLTGTAVVDVYTKSFPQTWPVYITTTASGASTYTSSVCKLPTS
ncbi:hypothetical protein B0T17DRAFT_91326 [Bombardia bombarda]|uniref:Uncharacterized protein n=1 Tax=Bombardia bombarda TaxID=252184 RepID=A0AA39XND5_9PEZI|nr:hypothetical protein B0T17DRAFT_91326 [Bombardia bombarda]